MAAWLQLVVLVLLLVAVVPAAGDYLALDVHLAAALRV